MLPSRKEIWRQTKQTSLENSDSRLKIRPQNVSGHNSGVKTGFGPKKVVVIRNSEVVVFVKLFYKETYGKLFGTFEVVAIARWSSERSGP